MEKTKISLVIEITDDIEASEAELALKEICQKYKPIIKRARVCWDTELVDLNRLFYTGRR